MNTKTIWENLAHAIDDMSCPSGDYNLKLQTISAGVELLFECPTDEIIGVIECHKKIPARPLVSWLVFEGERSGAISDAAVAALRERWESTCGPGQGILAAPPPGMLM